jgi:hypothetical protein
MDGRAGCSRRAATTLAAFLVAMAAPGGSAAARLPDPPPPAVPGSNPCAAPDKLVAVGSLDRAEAQFVKLLTRPEAADCAAAGLRWAADRRHAATSDAAAARRHLRAGDWEQARSWGRRALLKDAANREALAVLAEVEHLNPESRSEIARWDAFYAGRLRPLLRMFLPIVVVFFVLWAFSRLLVLLLPWFIPVGDRIAKAVRRRPADSDSEANPDPESRESPKPDTRDPPERTRVQWLGYGLLGLAVVAFSVSICLAAVVPPAGLDPALAVVAAVTVLVAWCGHALASEHKRWWFGYGLLVVAALASVGLAVFPPGGPDVDLSMALTITTGVGGFAVLLVAWEAGTRLKIQVDARDAEGAVDQSAGAYVAARLNDLGSSPPTGLIVPKATDVTGLPENAPVVMPEGWIAVALRMLLRLIPVVPWRADVVLLDDDRVTVDLTRNGRTVDSVSISRQDLHLPDDAGQDGERAAGCRARAQLLTAAAAFILVRLAECGHSELGEGLGGATHWESVACQVIAGGPLIPRADDQTRLRLLAHAVYLDQDNLTAQVALLTRRWRMEQMDNESVVASLDDMWRQVRERPSGYEALQLRILTTRAIIRHDMYVRRRTADGRSVGGSESDALQLAMNTVKDLLEHVYALQRRKLSSKVEAFVKETKPVANSLWVGALAPEFRLTEKPLDRDSYKDWKEEEPLSPYARYRQACLAAEANPPNWALALSHLEHAVTVERIRKDARDVPSFGPVSRRESDYDRFKKLVGNPGPKEFTELARFAMHRERLEETGIRTAEQLAARTSTRRARMALAELFGVPPLEVKLWRRIAKLALLHPDLDTAEDAAARLQVLLDAGIDSPRKLRLAALGAGKRGVRERLDQAAKPSQVVADDRKLKRWASGSRPRDAGIALRPR